MVTPTSLVSGTIILRWGKTSPDVCLGKVEYYRLSHVQGPKVVLPPIAVQVGLTTDLSPSAPILGPALALHWNPNSGASHWHKNTQMYM